MFNSDVTMFSVLVRRNGYAQAFRLTLGKAYGLSLKPWERDELATCARIARAANAATRLA